MTAILRCHKLARLLPVVGIAALLGLALPSVADATTATSAVSMVEIPENLGFDGFATSATAIALVGTVESGGGIAGDCDLAPVTTSPLGIGPTTLRACDDPALSGEPVVPVQTVLLPSDNEELHLARVLDGKVRLGPIIATYQPNSGSHPVYAYGDGALWIYENQGPKGPTLFQVSLATGAVVEAVRTPNAIRPLLLVDDDGAWLVPAGSFGAPTDVALYHLAPGSDRVVPALSLPNYAGGFAAWAVASGHSVEAAFCTRPITTSDCTLYDLSGPSAVARSHRANVDAAGSAEHAFAHGRDVYVLTQSRATFSSTPRLVDWTLNQVDMVNGAMTKVATVRLDEFWSGPDGTGPADAVLVDQTLFLITNPDSDQPAYLEAVRV